MSGILGDQEFFPSGDPPMPPDPPRWHSSGVWDFADKNFQKHGQKLIALLGGGTKCDQFGMTNERLNRGPLQWPCPDEKHPGTSRLYVKGGFHTDDGRARFVPVSFRHTDEIVSAEYPLALTT